MLGDGNETIPMDGIDGAGFELDPGPGRLTTRSRAADAALCPEGGPVRRCIATGDRLPQDRMIRFVLDPQAQVTPDLRAKLPGRGMWVRAERDAVEQAVRKSLFAKAMRSKAFADAGLADKLEQLLADRCVELLSLARRAGQAIAGFEKVRSALSEADTAVFITAVDGAEDGRKKLMNRVASIPVVDVLARTELAHAFGRDDCVHAVLKRGGLAVQFIAETGRLSGFRTTLPTGTAIQAGADENNSVQDDSGAGYAGGKG